MATAIEVPASEATGAPVRRPVPVTITPRPIADDEVRIVADLDDLFEGVDCSCNASDDQPY